MQGPLRRGGGGGGRRGGGRGRGGGHYSRWQHRSPSGRGYNSPRGPAGRGNDPPVGADHHYHDPLPEYGSRSARTACIAVEGCGHGALDVIYQRLQRYQEQTSRRVDLLIMAGDFQSVRHPADLHSLAVPAKYRALGDFYRYYSGEKVAPVLTILIGGNHEASQPLLELYYGGWLAPHIYYLGAAGVVRWRGLRLAGLSGIHHARDYDLGRYERPPFSPADLRSVYHVRRLDVQRLLLVQPSSSPSSSNNNNNSSSQAATADESTLSPPPSETTSLPMVNCTTDDDADRPRRIDLMLSHDWPLGMDQHGDTAALLRRKPFFRQEIQQNALGSPANRLLLDRLKPRWWLAAHLHVQFRATVLHPTTTMVPSSSSPPPPTVLSRPASTHLIPSQVMGRATATPPPARPEPDQNHHSDDAHDGDTTLQPTTTTEFLATASEDPCRGPTLTQQMTEFLALDKCLPRRTYLSLLHVELPEEEAPDDGPPPHDDQLHNNYYPLEYDVEWLAILRKTHSWTSTQRQRVSLPASPDPVTTEEMEWVRRRLGPWRTIPTDGFIRTVPCHTGGPLLPNPLPPPFPVMGNPQTDRLLALLELDHILTVPYDAAITESLLGGGQNRPASAAEVVPSDDNEIELEEDDVLVEEDAHVPGDDDNEIELEDDPTAAATGAPVGYVLDTVGVPDEERGHEEKRPRIEQNN